jgi:multidrug resistance efflux pump
VITLVYSDFELEYERAKVHVETTRRRLGGRLVSEPHVDMTSAERALDAANERLVKFSLDAAQDNAQKTQVNMQEIATLVQQGLATNAEFEEARRAAALSARDLQGEREHLSRLREEVDLATARVSNEPSLLQNPGRTEELNLRMELQEAETALKIAARHCDSQRLLSTGTGTVLKVMVNVGDRIPSGFPIVQIGQLDRLDFDVPVDALVARTIKVGQPMNVRIPTEPPTQIVAPVAAILMVPAQDQSAYTVRITVDNPARSAVLVGLSAQVEFPH